MGTVLHQRNRPTGLEDPPTRQPDARRRRFWPGTLVLHFRPKTVPESTLRLTLTWALGGTAATLTLLQMATGVMLKFAYDPSPEAAYASVQTLVRDVAFGPLVRNVHFWSANLLVAVVFLHMLRVFFTGAFHAPRRLNWLVGWALFVLLLAANFTGYLLPFDQLAYWAVTVSSGMLAYVPVVGPGLQEAVRGGPEIGHATLRMFSAVLAREFAAAGQAASTAAAVGTAVSVPALLAAVYAALRARHVEANEAVQAVFTLMVSAMASLTVIGVFFRGEGMRWVWWTLP